ncbi:MAG: hypothetical protein KJ799_07805 [Bacteroidetes bacterium]|nr:hypothetical protein [Bacteroidota bacterium]
MIRISVLIISVLMASNITSQNLDSLFNTYVKMRGLDDVMRSTESIHSEDFHPKCGFGISAILLANLSYFDSYQQSILKLLATRPQLDTSFVSPSGNFRIHYNLSGSTVPKYDLDELALALDSTYNFEVTILGYPAPHNDNGDGGDNLYDVYILNFGQDTYGETRFEENNAGVIISYMAIDDDFSQVPTIGINGAKVTVAHEFHHAIQVGNYGYKSEDTWYYELTSTSMEEFVFDDINDYYFYMSSYFRKPEKGFISFNGYELAVWNIYLKERFAYAGDPLKGYKIIKKSWELLKNYPALEAISRALIENNTSMKYEFNNFGLWNYLTGFRAKSGRFFSEAAFYPKITPIAKYSFSPPQKEYMNSAIPISNNYMVFDLGQNDTLVSIITYANITAGSKTPLSSLNYQYLLATSNIAGSRQIMDGYYSSISSSSNELFKESNLFRNDTVDITTTAMKDEIRFVYPQPFVYSKDQVMSLPVDNNSAGIADLSVYSISLDLVYSDVGKKFTSDKYAITWDGKTISGARLPTGVYIFVTDSDGKIKKGKLAIINE